MMNRLIPILREMGTKAHRSHDSGQALVELALTMPLLLLMLLGAVELGLVAYASIEVANSAKAAAQYGAQSPGTAAETAIMQQLAVNEAADYGLTLNTPISVTSSGACAIAGTVSTTTANCVANGGYLIQILTINTSADYTPLFKIPGIGPTFTVHGSAVQEVLF